MPLALALSALLAFVLLFFGAGVAKWLKIDDGLGRAGIAIVSGPAAWMVLMNALGFATSVTGAAWGSVAMLAAAGLAMHKLVPAHRIAEKPPKGVMHLLSLVIGACALAGMRFSGSDPWSWQHFPLGASIVAGNLPALTPIDPLQPLAYHYGPALIAAGIRLITGASLAAGFWSHPIIGSAGVVLCAAGLSWRLSKSWRAAWLGGVLALLGGGLAWLGGWQFVTDVYQHFVTGPALEAPFRNLTAFFDGHVATGLMPFFGHRSTAMGYPLVFALLYAFECGSTKHAPRLRWAAAGIVLALALALTHELSFVALPCCMLAGAVAILLTGNRERAKGLCALTLMIFVPAGLIALVQGGVLSNLTGEGSFSIAFDGTVQYTTWGHKAALWGWLLWQDLGLPILLLPLSTWVAWKRKATFPFMTALIVLVIAHCVVPFFVQYTAIEGEMRRLFYTSVSVGAVLAGIALEATALRSTVRWQRIAGWMAVLAMLGSSLVYVPVRLIIPNLRLAPAPLLSGLPAITEPQRALYQWVVDHTTQDDWFYLRSNLEDFRDLPDETGQQRDRVLFMTYTGRFTLGQVIFWRHDPHWLDLTHRLEASCDAKAFTELHLDYLVVETADRDAWFTKHCDRKAWETVYVGDAAPYPRIERLRR